MSSEEVYSEFLTMLDSPSRDPVRELSVSPGGRAWSYCPVHPDGTKRGCRSLSLSPRYGLTCFAGCDFRDVARALRERAGVHPTRQAPAGGAYRNGGGQASYRPGSVVAGRWTYADLGGRPLYREVKKRWPDGSKKVFFQHPAGSRPCCESGAAEPCKADWDDARWRWGRGDVTPVLYRWPELVAADPEATVFLVEGPGKADALRALGLTATSLAGGAKAPWRTAYTDTLTNRPVCILPDNDRPGVEYAERAGGSLLGHAREVRYVVLPALGYKDDIVDWLALGGTREDLLELVSRAPVVRPPSKLFPKAVDTRVLDATGIGPRP